MSDILIEGDDFLDGCALDFTIDPDDDETAELRPLFPAGAADAGLEEKWNALFATGTLQRRLAAAPHVLREAPGAGFDTGIADRLRALGLRVVEVAGWQTRGISSFFPKGSVDHHTAGPRSGNAPSLGVCINGRSDLPGPLCNVFVARDNTCYVVAAGRANHAGTGGWSGLSGNSSVYGVERENTGIGNEPWREDQRATAARVHAALLSGIGRSGGWVCEHKEWTIRKIDAWDQSGADMRLRTSQVLAAAPTPTPPPEEDEDVTVIMWFDGKAAYAVSGVMAKHIPDGNSLNLLKFLGCKEVNPVNANWYNTLCIVDGPFQNTIGKRIEEWGHWLDAQVGNPVDVDEEALANALAPLISGGATPAEIAKAVIAEIAS